MRYTKAAACLTTLLLLVPRPSPAQDAGGHGSAARQALPSVVTLRAYGPDGDQLRLGSGFFIEDGRIVTNSHVVAGAEWVEVSNQDGDLLGTIPYAEVISTRSDLAVLPAPSTDVAGLNISSNSPQPGEEVWVVGSPEGLHGSVSNGVVSAVRSVEGLDYLQISAPISSGSSGGPILDSQGNVIGVVVSYLSNGQNLNFGVHADRLSALINSPAGEYSFNTIQPPGTQGSDSEQPTETPTSEDVVERSPVLSLPSRQRGELTRSDFEGDERHYDLYRIQGEAGQTLSLAMQSDEIDTLVGIISRAELGEDDQWGETDDDSGLGTNSRLTVTLPASGEYVLFATSYAKEFGEYEMAVVEGDATPSEAEGGTPGDDGRWRHFATSTGENEWYFDPSTIVEEEEEVLVWVRHLPGADSEYDERLYRWGLDCDRRRFRVHSYANYVDDQVDSQDEIALPDWNEAPPESIAEGLIQRVCGS